MKVDYNSLSHHSQKKQDKWQKWREDDSPSQSRRYFLAIQNVHAFGPSCSNRLMVVNQNARAFRMNSTVVKKKMNTTSRTMVGVMSKMMIVSRHNFIHHRFSWSSTSWSPQSCPSWSSIFRMSLIDSFWKDLHEWSWGWEDVRTYLLICFWAPGLFQIDGCHKLEMSLWDLPRSLGYVADSSSFADFRFLARTNGLLSDSPFVVCLHTRISWPDPL